jgi:hypothetical protein
MTMNCNLVFQFGKFMFLERHFLDSHVAVLPV